MKNKTYDQVKQTYINHGTDPEVMRKLSPAHVIATKKLEIEERKLAIAADALKNAILARLVGGRDVVDGEVVEDGQQGKFGGSEETQPGLPAGQE